jgi:hypothetical protein
MTQYGYPEDEQRQCEATTAGKRRCRNKALLANDGRLCAVHGGQAAAYERAGGDGLAAMDRMIEDHNRRNAERLAAQFKRGPRLVRRRPRRG